MLIEREREMLMNRSAFLAVCETPHNVVERVFGIRRRERVYRIYIPIRAPFDARSGGIGSCGFAGSPPP